MTTSRLTVPSPCHENWQQMTPAATGRHCAACQQVVVDFTRFTDAELLRYLQQQAGRATCGRFRAGQLDRPLRAGAAPAAGTRWRAWLAAAVAVWGLREAAAPAAPAQTPTEQRQPQPPMPITLGMVAPSPVPLRGFVTDSVSQEPLPGAVITLDGTQLQTNTDANGYFELPVPPAIWAAHKKRNLTISFIGYMKQHILLNVAPTEPLQVMLPLDTYVLGGYISTTPTPITQRLWQHLKRPFQRW